MKRSADRLKPAGLLRLGLVAVVVGSLSIRAAAERPAVLDKPAPDTLDDLREIQRRVEAVAASANPATVALLIGFDSTGSGVVVSEDGFILTAAHVIGEPGRLIQVRFPDGTIANARTLGSDQQNDAGMAKLEGDGPWPFVEMADAQALQHGDWVVALGHPGGFDEDRTAVVRLGRVIRMRKLVGIQTDCSLIGGDSGGPLLDLTGKVVGIHSRIGQTSRTNIHVAVGDYVAAWDRLARGEQWRRTPYVLGVYLMPDEEGRGVLVRRVLRDSPAEAAGVRPGDVIVSLDDNALRDDGSVRRMLDKYEPGSKVKLAVLRGEDQLQLVAVLPEMPESLPDSEKPQGMEEQP